MRQDHFALKRYIRSRSHVVAVVDALDQAYLDEALELTAHSVARQFEIARQVVKPHWALKGVPNEDLYRGKQQVAYFAKG